MGTVCTDLKKLDIKQAIANGESMCYDIKQS